MSNSATGSSERGIMHIQSIIMIVICALTMVYLFYALLRPEKF